jgi:cytochrome P450
MTDADVRLGRSDADAARNRSFGAGLVDDPNPTYAEILRRGPVHEGSTASHFAAMAAVPSFGGASGRTCTAFGYEAGLDVLRRTDVFASEPFYGANLTLSIGPSVISLDGPAHRRMRSLLQPAFAKRRMDTWQDTIIRPIVDEHLDRIVAQGRADLSNDVGGMVPIHTIAVALGLPAQDRQQFFDWAIGMTDTTSSAEERQAASVAVGDYVAPLVAERRRDPRDDLISVLVQARVAAEATEDGADDRPLSDDEIKTFVRLLIIAGAGTTFRAYGALMFFLLQDPAQLDAVRADRSLVPGAIEESLRLEQPLAQIGRVATAACPLHGTTVPAGAVVEVNVGAANRDPEQWPERDVFDPGRPRGDRHLSFGFGVHRCLGIHLARAELVVMLERTLDRLPGLRLDPAADVHMTGLGFRMVNHLPVLFEPSAPLGAAR